LLQLHTTGRKLVTSNVVQNNLNPVWHEQTVDLGALCGNDTRNQVRIVVRDEDRKGANELLGEAAHVVTDGGWSNWWNWESSQKKLPFRSWSAAKSWRRKANW